MMAKKATRSKARTAARIKRPTKTKPATFRRGTKKPATRSSRSRKASVLAKTKAPVKRIRRAAVGRASRRPTRRTLPGRAARMATKTVVKRTPAIAKPRVPKVEKPPLRAEGALIKAAKKPKQGNLLAQPRFVRRIATPAPVASVKPPAPPLKKVVLGRKNVEELRRALEEERRRLVTQLAALEQTASLTGPSEVNETVPGYSIHLAEYASDSQVQETSLAQRALQAERLAEIEEALQKIGRPGYGVCQHCGNPIGLERLKIKPSAQYCVPCRQLKEQGRI